MDPMVLAYDIAYTAAAAATSPLWAYRLFRTGKWRTDWPARFGQCRLPGGPGVPGAGVPGAGEATQLTGRTLLIHAVSVGEVGAIRLLVDRLHQEAAGLRIVISTTTDTGTARARQLFEPDHAVVRFPFDWTCCVERFLDAVKPDLVGLVENEVWPNFMVQCAKRGVPACVINGRLTERSFRRYHLVRPVAKGMYGRLTAAAVQTEAYAQRFESLGTPAQGIKVLDTMKWDTAQVADHVDGADELAVAMGIDRARPLIVAGSTGPGEEQMLIEARPPQAQLLIVPRKPERFEQVAKLSADFVRRSQSPDGTQRPPDRHGLYLLDTMGELRKAYALADVAIVGRSFRHGLGGSDMIEPCALGKPTITGRHHRNFADTVAALQAGGGIEVTDQPGPAAAALLADPARASEMARRARGVIFARQGATKRHADLLMSLLEESH